MFARGTMCFVSSYINVCAGYNVLREALVIAEMFDDLVPGNYDNKLLQPLAYSCTSLTMSKAAY